MLPVALGDPILGGAGASGDVVYELVPDEQITQGFVPRLFSGGLPILGMEGVIPAGRYEVTATIPTMLLVLRYEMAVEADGGDYRLQIGGNITDPIAWDYDWNSGPPERVHTMLGPFGWYATSQTDGNTQTVTFSFRTHESPVISADVSNLTIGGGSGSVTFSPLDGSVSGGSLVLLYDDDSDGLVICGGLGIVPCDGMFFSATQTIVLEAERTIRAIFVANGDRDDVVFVTAAGWAGTGPTGAEGVLRDLTRMSIRFRKVAA